MKNSRAQAPDNQPNRELSDADALELPVDSEFVSLSPQIDFQVMLKRIEENMPWRSTRPGEMERRLAEKIPVEFIL
jgi:hypothetical protein